VIVKLLLWPDADADVLQALADLPSGRRSRFMIGLIRQGLGLAHPEEGELPVQVVARARSKTAPEPQPAPTPTPGSDPEVMSPPRRRRVGVMSLE